MSKKISDKQKSPFSSSNSEQSTSVHTDSLELENITEDSPTAFFTGHSRFHSSPRIWSRNEPESPPLLSNQPPTSEDVIRPKPCYALASRMKDSTPTLATTARNTLIGTAPTSAFSPRSFSTSQNPLAPVVHPIAQSSTSPDFFSRDTSPYRIVSRSPELPQMPLRLVGHLQQQQEQDQQQPQQSQQKQQQQ